MHDPKKAPNLEIAVASHHAHGKEQIYLFLNRTNE